MRTSMKIIAFVLIAAATVLIFAVSIQLYADRKRTLNSDMPLYFGTEYFFLAVAGSLALVVAYLMFDLKSAKTKTKIAALLPIILLTNFIGIRSAEALDHPASEQHIIGSLITPNQIVNRTDKVIHVLGVGDEEFDFLYPEGWERYLGWEIYINEAFDRFHTVFDLKFKLTGWLHWDSTDFEGNNTKLLEEAINETFWKPGRTICFGYVNDLLLVMTSQIIWREGWSYPPWRALIIDGYPLWYPRVQLLMHELTHQFYVEECTSINECVMAMADSVYYPPQWCNHCTNELNTNGYKNRFDRIYSVRIGPRACGGGRFGCHPM